MKTFSHGLLNFLRLQEFLQYSLFYTNDLNKEAKLIFDPNTIRFSTNKTNVQNIQNHADSRLDHLEDMPIVHATWISEDGYRIAYGYTDNINARKMTIRVRDLRMSKDLLLDIIEKCYVDYTSVSWLESRSGFFYTTQVILHRPDNEHDLASPQSNQSNNGNRRIHISHRVMFHRINTSQDQDFIVFETVVDHDDMVINTQISSDRRYLLLGESLAIPLCNFFLQVNLIPFNCNSYIDLFKKKKEISNSSLWRSVISEHAPLSSYSPLDSTSTTSGNKVFFYDISSFDGLTAETLVGRCMKLIDTFSYRFEYISNIEEEFWFRTNYNAPNFRVVRYRFLLSSIPMSIG